MSVGVCCQAPLGGDRPRRHWSTGEIMYCDKNAKGQHHGVPLCGIHLRAARLKEARAKTT